MTKKKIKKKVIKLEEDQEVKKTNANKFMPKN